MNTDNLKKEIKKITIGHVALLCTGIFLAFLIIGSILIAVGGVRLNNDGWDILRGNFFELGSGKMYDVNDHADLDLSGVDSVSIIAISNDINLQSGEKATADLNGQCSGPSGPVVLNARKSGSTLTIEVKYPNNLRYNNTRLNVVLPTDYAGSLSLSTVSGDVKAEALPYRLDKVGLHSVSGDIAFQTTSYNTAKSDTISGNISITGIEAETSAKTISGDVELQYETFAATTVVTISGGVTAEIPAGASFKVDFGSVSGDFRSDHPGLGISSADRGFSGFSGENGAIIKVNTTSGNFRIEGK